MLTGCSPGTPFPLLPSGSLWRAGALIPGFTAAPDQAAPSHRAFSNPDIGHASTPLHTAAPETPAAWSFLLSFWPQKNKRKNHIESIDRSESIKLHTETAWNQPDEEMNRARIGKTHDVDVNAPTLPRAIRVAFIAIKDVTSLPRASGWVFISPHLPS